VALAFVADPSIKLILGIFIQLDQISDGDLTWFIDDIDGVIESFNI
jgi:hypothetical protein